MYSKTRHEIVGNQQLFVAFVYALWCRCCPDWHKFKRLLASKTFAVHDTERISGERLTADWAEQSGFREPVIAPDRAGMGLEVCVCVQYVGLGV